MKPSSAADPINPARRALLIFCAAVLVRVAYYLLIRRTACLDINLDPVSDMEAFHRWAITIASGDWLGRSDFHPFHPWQTAVAPPGQWADWYGHVFHQEPFYPYLVAFLYLLAPAEPSTVIVAQMLLGAAGCALTYLAARRLVSEGAALCAGILSVLYGPYLYYESLVLRDSFMIPLTACIIWLLCEARTRSRLVPAGGWWLVTGLTIGVSYTTKAGILPFFMCLVIWLGWQQTQRAPRSTRNAAPVLLLLLGFALPIVPLALRNGVVGAPLLKITTRGPIEYINGNNHWHRGIGWFDGDDSRVSSYAAATLTRAGGRLGPTVRAVLADWKNDPTGWAMLQVRKTAYFFAPFEMPNNASYSWFRLNCPLLRMGLLSFFVISPLALAGLVESWRRWREFLLLYLFLATGVAVTIAFYVIARFRAPFMPVILIFAGHGLWSLAENFRRRDWKRLVTGLVLITVTLAVNRASNYQDRQLLRPQDYLISIEGYRQRGQMEQAIRDAEEGRRQFPSFAVFHKEAAFLYLGLGRNAEAVAAFREALARDPSDTETRSELNRLGAPPP